MKSIKTLATSKIACAVAAVCVLTATPGLARGKRKPSGPDPYYKIPAIFLPCPDSRLSTGAEIRHFGPVGLGLELVAPNLTIKIVNVEEGSPAAATGKLSPGQIIESINGRVFKDRDPRMILGDLITEAEATDGRLVLRVKGKGDVVVKLTVMGAYSKTWPVNCRKSDKIVRKLASILAKQETPRWGSIMFLLSTGEEEDLEVVKRWMKDPQELGTNWGSGTEGSAYCEYYLRTGDRSILPFIRTVVMKLESNMWMGNWNARGVARFGYGPLSASGVHCLRFLAMAKLCGVKVDKDVFNIALKQYYRFAGHGNVAYGSGLPEGGFRDNGKTSGLAMTTAALALLSPDGEASKYAKARDISATKSFYATNWFRAAHTGGGIGEVWHHWAMNLVREKRPGHFRSYFDTRRWLMDLSRRPDGSIGVSGQIKIKGNCGYDKSATEGDRSHGTEFALTYTFHRKKLQLFGAPRSPYAKYDPDLPKRPWGNTRDDIFLDGDPIPGSSLTKRELLHETVEKDASLPVLVRLRDPKLPDDLLLKYLHHPEIGLRVATMRTLCRLNRGHLVMPLLKASDGRLRHAGLLALAGMFKGSPLKDKTPEMLARAGEMLEDRNEAWWITQEAARALAVSGSSEIIAKHKARLVELVESDTTMYGTYTRKAALTALAKICLSKDHYRSVLPVLIKYPGDRVLYITLQKGLARARPEVKEFLKPRLKETFSGIPQPMRFAGGAICRDGGDVLRSRVAMAMDLVPGGSSFILFRPKETVASVRSGRKSDMYQFNGKYNNDPRFIGTWSMFHLKGISEGSPEAMIKEWYSNVTKGGKRKYTPPTKINYGIQLGAGGKAKILGYLGRKYGEYVWTDNVLIGKYADEALKMRSFSHAGRSFLIFEKALKNLGEVARSVDGGAAVEEKPSGNDWHPGYSLCIKVNDNGDSGKRSKKRK